MFYEFTQPCSSLPASGSSPVAVTAQLEGLSAKTTYHFRIVASNQGGTSSGGDRSFTTLPNPPAVGLMNPSAGPESGGTEVTISGTNLNGATSVRFGSADATSFTVGSDSSINALSPPGTGTVDVTVTTAGGTSPDSSSDRFSYAGSPTVTGVMPGKGPVGGGTTVTISGTNLTGATAVEFGSTGAASYTVKSATSIGAVSAAEPAGVVQVSVATPGGTSAASSTARFRFTPTITGLSPNAGSTAGGTSVTVTGTGFALGTQATIFRFASARAAAVDCTATTTCTITAPAHAVGPLDVRATVNRIESPKSLGDGFIYE
jgi:hypothetical protein